MRFTAMLVCLLSIVIPALAQQPTAPSASAELQSARKKFENTFDMKLKEAGIKSHTFAMGDDLIINSSSADSAFASKLGEAFDGNWSEFRNLAFKTVVLRNGVSEIARWDVALGGTAAVAPSTPAGSPTPQEKPGAPASAQQSFSTFKGHRIRETFQEFLAITGQADILARCRTEKKLDRSMCNGLSQIDSGARGIVGPTYPDQDTFTFANGSLVKLELYSGANPFESRDQNLKHFVVYEEVVAAVVQKIGRPTEEQQDLAEQNGYGAIFHHRQNTWDTDALHVEVYEVSAEILKGPRTLTRVQDQQDYQEQNQKARQDRKPIL